MMCNTSYGQNRITGRGIGYEQAFSRMLPSRCLCVLSVRNECLSILSNCMRNRQVELGCTCILLASYSSGCGEGAEQG
eukprot:6118236-Pleurochrysis_carterae.AAC.1